MLQDGTEVTINGCKKSRKITNVTTSGKRKTSIARAVVSKGKGRVRVNGQPIHIMEPTLARRKH